MYPGHGKAYLSFSNFFGIAKTKDETAIKKSVLRNEADRRIAGAKSNKALISGCSDARWRARMAPADSPPIITFEHFFRSSK